MERLHYPETPTVEQIDDYHGTLVSDPYRWLEDTNSAETEAWINAQNQLTQTNLEDVPSKEHIRKRLTELWDYPRAFAPLKVKGRYFQLRLITIDTRRPEKTAWKTIFPENGDAVDCIKLVNNQFIVIYLHYAYHQVKRFDTAGNFLGEIALPMRGTNRYICFLSQST